MSESKSPGRRGLTTVRDAPSRLRPQFLVTFTLLGVLVVGALVYVVGAVMSNDVREDQVAGARERAELLAGASFAPRLRGPLHDLGAKKLRALDVAAIAAQRSGNLSSLTVWDRNSRIVYSSDHRQIDKVYRPPAAVTAALSGKTVVEVADRATSPVDKTAGKQIQVAVPLTGRDGQGRARAAFELHVPYGPVATEISRRSRRINLILIGAAVLFFAAVFPRLLSASRALRSQSDPAARLLVRELGRAIDEGELHLDYQPKVDLRTGEVSSVEALLRWEHPRKGLLGPADFLPVVGESDLIGPLTVHLLDLGMRDCSAWRAEGMTAGVDLNLAAANVLDPLLPGEVQRLLEKWELPASALGLELTETAVAADPDGALVVLRRLADLGVRLAIDDFGTGYSSLTVLRDLPIRELKIDRSFVSGLVNSPADERIVRSTIGLAHDFEVIAVAEGVEDEDTLVRLAELGCDHAQGYYFSRPVRLDALVQWFRAPSLAAAAQVDAQPVGAPSA
jgi:EAL domain-containing protein (putative c-di-GMP-specific phosphodiesterase class I)